MEICKRCSKLEELKPVAQRCLECKQSMCFECATSHMVQRDIISHHFVELNPTSESQNLRSLDSLCSKHDLPFEYYCVDHENLSCNSCRRMNHRFCNNFISIEAASVQSKGSQSFFASVELIEQILEALKTLRRKKAANEDKLITEKEYIRFCILKEKRNIIRTLDQLEKNLLDKLNQKHQDCLTDICEKDTFVQDALMRAQEQKNVFEYVKDNGSDEQTFLLIHSTKDFLNDLQQNTKQLTENATEITMKFHAKEILQSITDLGSISVVETSSAISFVPVKQNQSQNPVEKSLKEETFALHKEIRTRELGVITGMSVSDDNYLLLCNMDASKLVVCDENGELNSSVYLKYNPWDIAILPNTTIAVISCSCESYLQFVDFKRKIRLEEKSNYGIEQGGIASTIEHIIVGGNDRTIHVLDHSGTFLSILYPEVNVQSSIWYVSVGENGDIYFTDAHNLHCVTSEGKSLFTKLSSEMTTLRKVATTQHDRSIFVVCFLSGNIKKLTNIGDKIENILTEKEGIQNPMALCFNKDHTKLYVANTNGESVLIFKMK